MGHYYIVFAAIGAAAVIVGGVFNMYQLYRLVQVDAQCRGLKHPKLWGAFAVSGNNSSGLLLYLIGRKRYPVLSMSEEQKTFIGRCKKGVGVGFAFSAVGAIVCVLSLLLGGRLI